MLPLTKLPSHRTRLLQLFVRRRVRVDNRSRRGRRRRDHRTDLRARRPLSARQDWLSRHQTPLFGRSGGFSFYADNTVDVSDIADQVGKDQVGFYDESTLVANNGKRWHVVPKIARSPFSTSA